MKPAELSSYRGRVASMIFQEPLLALDPVYSVGEQIVEAIRRHEPVSRRAARGRARDLFERVRIPSPERRLDAYPHELSGGMRQRAMIALALACGPQLLLADEPTTALDATVQIQILLLLRELQRDLGLSVIFVTHDIGAAVEVADRIAVMYAGRIVELASARDLDPAGTSPLYTGAAEGPRRQRAACNDPWQPAGDHRRIAPGPGSPAARLRLRPAVHLRSRRMQGERHSRGRAGAGP